MENRTNRRLLLLFAATLFFYLVLAICASMPSWMMLGFPVIPAFCLQLLLCRVLRRKWLAVLPLVVIGRFLLGWLAALYLRPGNRLPRRLDRLCRPYPRPEDPAPIPSPWQG